MELQGNLLMIFVRNPELGKVKTRLAKSIGDGNALKVYKHLLNKTIEESKKVSCFRMALYSEYVDFKDQFNPNYFLKDEQLKDPDLGKRMSFSFIENFNDGFESIVLIGSDCLDISSKIIQTAFEKLNDFDVVIGPANDGGYYLIGMNKSYPFLFKNKEWSTSNVLLDTILDLKSNNLSYHLLEALSDVDTEEDLTPELRNLLE